MLDDSDRFAFVPHRIHGFASTGNAYDATQTDELIPSNLNKRRAHLPPWNLRIQAPLTYILRMCRRLDTSKFGAQQKRRAHF